MQLLAHRRVNAVAGDRDAPPARTELRAGASLSAIFGLRMLGLFFILPVFAVHAPQYAGGEDLVLVGMALGQLVYGPLSDRFGRKRVFLYAVVGFTIASGMCGAVITSGWKKPSAAASGTAAKPSVTSTASTTTAGV